jgi:autoinducer 2 (AI-2) kinase
MASLGSLVADEATALTKGGFVFHAPVSRQLTRADFVWAILWDIACSIKLNYDSLCDVVPYKPDYIWGCGGGFQSRTLSRFIAGLINKQVRLRKGFQHSSVAGGVIICNEALGIQEHAGAEAATIYPQQHDDVMTLFEEWKATRQLFSGRS